MKNKTFLGWFIVTLVGILLISMIILPIEKTQVFATVVLSVVLEALPFILLGTLLSSLIGEFVSEELIARILPKNRFLGIFLAGLVGLIFPLCECAIIPVMRKLHQKGVPLGMATTFMLSTPIINPVVLLSTYYAFMPDATMLFLRAGVGYLAAVLIGIIIMLVEKKNVLRVNIPTVSCEYCNHNHDHDHDHHHHHHHHHEKEGRLLRILAHTSEEFYDVGRYLIMGAILSGLIQTFVSTNWLSRIGSGQFSGIILMMILAFLLSICSEADAFIARTFMGAFGQSSILAFLIFGPMLDIKNLLMLTGSFKTRFVLKLIAAIVLVCFTLSLAVSFVI